MDKERKLALMGPGPWVDEPDIEEWRSDLAELPCSIERCLGEDGDGGGHLCGYVTLPAGHPWHGKSLHDLTDVAVHGGITYAQSGPDGSWVVGFDANHGYDYAPRTRLFLDEIAPHLAAQRELLKPLGGRDSGAYRDFVYMRGQVELLAAQAVLAASVNSEGTNAEG